MKRKLFVSAVLLTLGWSPNIKDHAVAWWQWQNAAPSPEAQHLIDSLESAGWGVSCRTRIPGGDCPMLVRGDLHVIVRTWHADVEIGSADANGCFTFSELRAINHAAENRLRKVAVVSLRSSRD